MTNEIKKKVAYFIYGVNTAYKLTLSQQVRYKYVQVCYKYIQVCYKLILTQQVPYKYEQVHYKLAPKRTSTILVGAKTNKFGTSWRQKMNKPENKTRIEPATIRLRV